MIKLRKATIKDAEVIHKLVSHFAGKGIMLPRSLNSVYESIRDFWVAEDEGAREVLACVALHVIGWEGLAEVRSLSVKEDTQKTGYGKLLVEKCIEEAKELGIKRLFALTFVPDFFLHLGFNEIDKNELPHKIWSDCIDCPFFPDCKEIAVEIKVR